MDNSALTAVNRRKNDCDNQKFKEEKTCKRSNLESSD